jgi:hypothetical protein
VVDICVNVIRTVGQLHNTSVCKLVLPVSGGLKVCKARVHHAVLMLNSDFSFVTLV